MTFFCPPFFCLLAGGHAKKLAKQAAEIQAMKWRRQKIDFSDAKRFVQIRSQTFYNFPTYP